MINQIINKLEKANSFIIRLIPHSFLVFVIIISKSYANRGKRMKFIEIKGDFKIYVIRIKLSGRNKMSQFCKNLNNILKLIRNYSTQRVHPIFRVKNVRINWNL